ncbi:acyl carrier protein [Streptomyces sp. NPDC048723]|uniref:acyl carrier protein n=1 Tax=unclassified Streptomyces TaxID=2593676 RepID=UPI0035678574
MTVPLSVSSIREELRVHLADVLYCETSEIDDDATFNDLSLDSVLGVELVSVINTKYTLAESVDAVFEHPTLRKLADYICERVAAQT